MVIILSPSKTSEIKPIKTEIQSMPTFLNETYELIQILKAKSKEDIQKLMSLSDKLTEHTLALIANLTTNMDSEHTRSAIYNFSGEVYNGLDAASFHKKDLAYAQKYLRILSGLYGVLRPCDLMTTYRLEMGTRLKTSKGTNLYQFWGDKLTNELNSVIDESQSNYLLNLASDEYAKSIQFKSINTPVIDVEFFELRNDKKVFVSFSAKKARGLLAAYVIKNQIKKTELLKKFNTEGYIYDEASSDANNFTFIRKV